MVSRPQKTKFQLKIVENIQTLSIWANNPWRRYSISLITLLIGYFLGSSLGMVSAVAEIMDPVAAFLSVVFIEILIALRRNFRFKRKRKFLLLLLDSLRLGLFYGFFTESLKLL
jgi:apolipoprotein N-acyltransferase